MNERGRNLIVGGTVLAGVVGFIFLLLVFGYLPRLLQTGYHVEIELEDAVGVNPGSRVDDMGVFIISPSDKGGKLYDAPAKLTDLCGPLHPIEFNNLWTLRNPGVHTLSLGAARTSDYDLALSSIAKMDQADTLLPPIETKLADAMTAAIGHPSPEAFSWDGVPEHYDEPHNLNLPILLWLRNLVVGWDMSDYGKMRFNLFGNGGHWFPGRLAKDIGDVPAAAIAASVKDSPHAEQIPGWVADAVDRMLGEAGKRLGDA